ncbi:hypothetical protein HBI56_149370 [Parastagonospora nodorum]|nr:hypothetical protein HBH53_052670 [Parastagonospora nodorum]KAH3981911.1 hypothetical protein HBH51_042440 [Parastagonospora nodorum]KAH3983015.1 hypothetical protein HBH52_069960 [Parastagonospora nodorum]KAH4023706.1 hypothetical protein HBI09_162730 [Parastagonospora nodorum]KAH4045883.1 hypothetical protein HBH49_196910 [Parastagonospora nodorum]
MALETAAAVIGILAVAGKVAEILGPVVSAFRDVTKHRTLRMRAELIQVDQLIAALADGSLPPGTTRARMDQRLSADSAISMLVFDNASKTSLDCISNYCRDVLMSDKWKHARTLIVVFHNANKSTNDVAQGGKRLAHNIGAQFPERYSDDVESLQSAIDSLVSRYWASVQAETNEFRHLTLGGNPAYTIPFRSLSDFSKYRSMSEVLEDEPLLFETRSSTSDRIAPGLPPVVEEGAQISHPILLPASAYVPQHHGMNLIWVSFASLLFAPPITSKLADETTILTVNSGLLRKL